MRKLTIGTAALLLSLGVSNANAGVVQEQQEQIDELFERVAVLEAQNNAMASLLAGVSRTGNTLLFSGMNLQLVNGLGATDGDTGNGPAVNGLGNLLIGYNETFCPEFGDCYEKTGSHNLVIGAEHGYSSFAGVVVGKHHRSYGAYAAVVGGYGSIAAGTGAGVFGGQNSAALGTFSAVFGGEQNYADEWWSVVAGGYGNAATNGNASVFGGFNNDATGIGANVTGGSQNEAGGSYSTVSGGSERSAVGTSDWVAGSQFEDE